MSLKAAVTLSLVGALILTSVRLADVERQRYALLIGLCQHDPQSARAPLECLQTVEPRTSWLWNLWYGLRG